MTRIGLAAGGFVVVAALSLVAAQGRQGAGAARANVPDFSGTWDPAGRCFPNGETCPWKLEDIPINERAAAHRRTFDEIIAPKYDCVPATSPGIIADPYMMRVEQRPDRVIIQYEKDDVVRTAWTGSRKSPANEFTLQGFSTARYEGNTLVIETTNFVYDPTGLDDMAGLPSSQQKKVVERYTRDGNTLRATITTDDPLFLVAPATFSTQWRLAPTGARMEKYDCDPKEARQPLQFLPPKYKQARGTVR